MRKTTTPLAFIVILALCMAAMGCASSATHPGAVNQVDSQLYDSLVVAQLAIEQAKVDLGTDPAAKPTLNKIIASYNAAMDAYLSYHQLVASGKTADAATLQGRVVRLVADISTLKKTFGKNKGGAS